MCGRYSRRSDKQRIAEAFRVATSLHELEISPDLDAAPGSHQPVITLNDEGERQLELMRWGNKMPDGRLLFNARSETLATASFWNADFLERRCIVPADSFYEWLKTSAARKKPRYEFTIPTGRPFGMAAIWKPWKYTRDGLLEHTFSILTTDPNAIVAPIHNRQPVILHPRDYAAYLTPPAGLHPSQNDAPDPRPPLHLLRPLPDDALRATLLSEEPITNAQATLFDSQ